MSLDADEPILAFLNACQLQDLSAAGFTARAELAALQAELEGAPAPEFARLAAWRLLASNSLAARDSTCREGWDRANAVLAQRLERGEGPSIACAVALHAALGVGASSFRDAAMYTADEEYLSSACVASALDRLDRTLADPALPTLQKAFCAYVGIVTVHPFDNGNGRVARLLADSVLLGAGMLPLCFLSPVSSHVAQTKGGVRRTVEMAFETFLRGAAGGYRVVLRKTTVSGELS